MLLDDGRPGLRHLKRKVTLSTSAWCDDRQTRRNYDVALALSLHAPKTIALRNELCRSTRIPLDSLVCRACNPLIQGFGDKTLLTIE